MLTVKEEYNRKKKTQETGKGEQEKQNEMMTMSDGKQTTKVFIFF